MIIMLFVVIENINVLWAKKGHDFALAIAACHSLWWHDHDARFFITAYMDSLKRERFVKCDLYLGVGLVGKNCCTLTLCKTVRSTTI